MLLVLIVMVVLDLVVFDLVVMVTILTLSKAQMTPPSRSHRSFEEHSARVDSGEPKSIFGILLQSCFSALGLMVDTSAVTKGLFKK